MKPIDIILIIIIALILILAIRRIIINRIKKKGCSCGCSECSGYCDKNHPHQ